MLMDIFSSFDPATISLFNTMPSLFFWLINFLFILSIIPSFWTFPSTLFNLTASLKDIMENQVSRTLGTHIKGFTSLLTSLFTLIIFTNLTGLFPYVFSTTSHLFLTMALALPIWASLIISSAMTSPKKFLAGILPGGAPDWLNPFLVLVETLSIMVRPVTLSFRLAANMSAGHIVLGLMGIYAASSLLLLSNSFLILISIQTLYMIFELGICLIQAYIFCLLLSLYSDDHTSWASVNITNWFRLN